MDSLNKATTSPDIAGDLLSYLRSKFDAPSAEYAEAPLRFSSGVENRVYGFRLRDAPDKFSGALVLRLFGGHVTGERARLEAGVQNAVASSGFVAPRVLHVCGDIAPLGGPFVIMERAAGDVMLASLTRPGASIVDLVRLLPPLLLRMPGIIADLQAQLHELDADTVRATLSAAGLDPASLTLDRHFERMNARIVRAQLDGLREGFEWVESHRPAEPLHPVMCHGDLWYGNVIQHRGRVTGVIDWSMDAMLIGDPAYDAAVTSILLIAGAADVPFFLWPIARGIQVVLTRRFLRACARREAIDVDLVRYYQLLRCVDFLSWVAERRVSPSLRTHEERDMLDVRGATEGYVAFFRKRTGITLTMPPPGIRP